MATEKLFILVLGLVVSIFITQITSCKIKQDAEEAVYNKLLLEKGATPGEIACTREVGTQRGASKHCEVLLKQMSDRADRTQQERLLNPDLNVDKKAIPDASEK